MFASLIGLVSVILQINAERPAAPLSVAEAVNDGSKYINHPVTIAGVLTVSMEFTAVSGSGCTERINALKKPYACAVSLSLPDCARPQTGCSQSLIELRNRMRRLVLSRERTPVPITVTGILQLPPKIFVEYTQPPVISGLPKGEYVEMGFGHMNAFPAQLIVMDGRLILAEKSGQ